MFTHLHLHTEYSLLDGACSIKPLMKRLKELNMDACAITDHGVMYGVVDFYRAAKEAGIHPVIGCEVYVCPNMEDKTSVTRDYSHLVLLCENQEGYRNLSKLVTESFLRGFYYRPRVDYDELRKYSKGLIALSACLSGEIPKHLLNGRRDEARKTAEIYRDIFGNGNFFIEIQDHGLPEQKQVLPQLVRLAREMDIPLVATNDCHYLEPTDAEAQEVLMCIQTGKNLDDENRMRMNSDKLYVRSEEEMQKVFPNFPDAIENTGRIAARCNVEFDFSTTHLPQFPLPEGEDDAEKYLRKLCEEGLKKRYPEGSEEAEKRLNYELGVISNMGYVDYFLIVWDFIHYAKTHGIGVGPGRGSGAGSIVAYSLAITDIDPLKYGLLFERFLNPERISMPDIDVDFDYERRSEVIQYVERRYGSDHVAQIITFGTMAARGVVRDVGRVLGLSYQQTDMVAKLIPFELGMTLERALSVSGELRRACEEDEQVARLIDMAKKLEGMPRHTSTHAAGVLITRRPVSDYMPLQTNDEVITTQFPMGTVEALGLLKMDFLGLRTLNVIQDTIDLAMEQGEKPFVPNDIPLDDPAVYEMISSGETDGVFQLESAGMRRFLMNMRPACFEDIIAAISLYRPGPMDSIPRYIQGKEDPSKVEYLTPELKPILDVTYGCMVYQEQVMQIVRDLAGYSMGRSDLVRRAMSKKKHDVMAKEKENFIHGLVENGEVIVPGAVRRGVKEQAAEQIFDEMTAFASYAFNKSHAAAYAKVAVETGWLKCHFPAEFMAATMNSMAGKSDKIAFYIQYCQKSGIRVLPPDVNKSKEKFSVDMEDGKKVIRFGLAGVKNLGHGAIRTLLTERDRGGAFRDLYDLIDRVNGGAMNKKGVESLIRAGAMDTLPGARSQKLHVFERAMDAVSKQAKTTVAGQMSLFGMDEAVQAPRPPLPPIKEFDHRMRLQMEKEATGVYISGHPLDEYREKLMALEMNSQVLTALQEEAPDAGLSYDQKNVVMGGIVAEKKLKAVKSGNMMAFVQLEDLYGITEVLVFPRVYERVSAMIGEDSAVLMAGKLSIREEEAPKLILDRVMPLEASVAEIMRRAPGRGNGGYGTPADYAPDHGNVPPADYVPVYDNAPPADYVPNYGASGNAPRRTVGGGGPSARRLYLRFSSEQRERVVDILRETPGATPVVFCEAGKKAQMTPREYWIDEGRYDFFALANLLGDENVVCK